MLEITAPAVCVFLQPGEMVLLTRPGRVKTVLGSCVAITMRERISGVSAIVHCLLPNAGMPFDSLPPGDCYRYVDSAVRKIMAQFPAN